jgi:hypothetical protein
MKLIIYTRFPAVVAELLETHYKSIVIPDAAEMLGPIEQGSIHIEFPYSGLLGDDEPLSSWVKWARNCGLVGGYKLTKEQSA